MKYFLPQFYHNLTRQPRFCFNKTSAHTSQKFQHLDINFINFDLVFVTRWFLTTDRY